MNRQVRFLLIISIIAVTGTVCLQGAWLNNYYLVNKEKFVRTVSEGMVYAKAKEYQGRYDNIQSRLAAFLKDTTRIRITSKWLPRPRMHYYKVSDVRDTTRGASFGVQKINAPIERVGDTVYNAVADMFAYSYRKDNLEKGVVYYEPTNFGIFADSLHKNYFFDKAIFDWALKEYLLERDISNGFKLVDDTSENGSENKKNFFSKIVTPTTWINTNSSRVIGTHAIFDTPYSYLVKKMLLLLGGSLVLVLVTMFCFYRILRSLFLEKKLSAIKNDFISNITHEFKTPIATVSAAFEALEHFNAYEDQEKRKKYFRIGNQEINRLSEMVNKILNISIYENESLELRKVAVSPVLLIEEILRNFEMIKTKTIDWKINGDAALVVNADRELLHIALSNVFDNAIKYSGDPVKIITDVSRQENQVFITVRDNGRGMQQADTRFAFEKFYRAASSREEKIKGYGLGLSYTRSIIDAHKGSYKITSELGKGTTVTLSIPAK